MRNPKSTTTNSNLSKVIPTPNPTQHYNSSFHTPIPIPTPTQNQIQIATRDTSKTTNTLHNTLEPPPHTYTQFSLPHPQQHQYHPTTTFTATPFNYQNHPTGHAFLPKTSITSAPAKQTTTSVCYSAISTDWKSTTSESLNTN
jgi:hypothetical protein